VKGREVVGKNLAKNSHRRTSEGSGDKDKRARAVPSHSDVAGRSHGLRKTKESQKEGRGGKREKGSRGIFVGGLSKKPWRSIKMKM